VFAFGILHGGIEVEEKSKEEPVYEKLNLNECMIISKGEKGILIACNKDGDVELKRIP